MKHEFRVQRYPMEDGGVRPQPPSDGVMWEIAQTQTIGKELVVTWRRPLPETQQGVRMLLD